jgi:hypothetical protein
VRFWGFVFRRGAGAEGSRFFLRISAEERVVRPQASHLVVLTIAMQKAELDSSDLQHSSLRSQLPAAIVSSATKMNKLGNMRHWSERIGPGFGMSRPNMNMTAITPHKSVNGASPMMSPNTQDPPIHYAFNVPFASDLAGPNVEDILYATLGAVERWTHPADAPDDVPIHELPVHANNVTALRQMCKDLTTGPLPIEAHLKTSSPKRVKGEVTTVCLSGSPELVHKSRETILNDTPLALVRKCSVCTEEEC